MRPRRILRCAIALLVFVTGGVVAFPTDPLDVTVEAYYSATWNDITEYVFDRTAAALSITRGRTNEESKTASGRLLMQINNADGRFSPRNPNSPLYGLIGRNTPIRVKVTHNAVTYTRFHGEVTSWPSRWDPSGADVWVPLEAAGILRRLSRSSRPQQSSLYRAMIGAASGDVVPYEYWPLEDGTDSTRYASAVGGIRGIGRISNSGTQKPRPGAHDGIPGSSTSALLPAGSAIDFPVRAYTDTGQWVIQSAVVLDTDAVDLVVIAYLSDGGRVLANVQGSLTAEFELEAVRLDSTGAETYGDFVDLTGGLHAGQPLSLAFGSTDTGGGDDFFARVIDGLGTVRAELTTTNLGHATVRSITVLNSWDFEEDEAGASHVALFTDPTFDPDVDTIDGARAASGWLAEPADERFAHLCAQAHVSSTVVSGSAAQMGRERTVPRLQALRDCEDADQGAIYETRDDLGLTFRSNSSRYGQLPVTLDYAAQEISPPFEPLPDDLAIANDREVRRRDGSSARAEKTTGALSTQDPPDGVGRYDDSITVDVYTDEQVEQIANWRLHTGTWDAERYPMVRVNLAGSPSLIPTVAPLDTGDYMRITNLPDWLPPEDAQLFIEGYRESLGQYVWDITFNTSPAGAYQVVGRWGLLAHELHAAINTAVTSIDIATTDVTQPLLETDAALIGSGYGITIGGEELQLTAVADSTITYGAVGTAVHVSNTSVTPTLPAGVASGHLLVCLAAIRNSGTGTVNAPTGYTRLPVFPSGANVQIFAKIAGGSETDPTVTITGGVANASVSAQIIRLTGKWHDVDNILVGAATRLNTSAQNIILPGLPLPPADNCIVIAAGWKQDDWTSVATLSGMTEIADPSTQTGDDQGIVWDYVIQTTAAAIAATSFVVTDGASAISRSAIFALRCDYQTATVERSINGVSASHSAADAVTMTNPMRWALI